MKTMKLAFVPISLLTLGLATGCVRQSRDQAQNEAARDTSTEIANENVRVEPTEVEPTLPAIGNTPDTTDVIDANATQTEFSQVMNDRLNAFDQRIQVIEQGIENKGAAVEGEFATKLTALKEQRQTAETHLNELKSAGETAWTNRRQDVVNAFTSLEASVVEAEEWIRAH